MGAVEQGDSSTHYNQDGNQTSDGPQEEVVFFYHSTPSVPSMGTWVLLRLLDNVAAASNQSHLTVNWKLCLFPHWSHSFLTLIAVVKGWNLNPLNYSRPLELLGRYKPWESLQMPLWTWLQFGACCCINTVHVRKCLISLICYHTRTFTLQFGLGVDSDLVRVEGRVRKSRGLMKR